MSEEEEKKTVIDKLNSSLLDFAGSVFGESGREFIEKTQNQIKDFSSSSVKKFIEFSDSMLEKLNLNENEQVMKARDSVEDLLKQSGLLQEEDEEEF